MKNRIVLKIKAAFVVAILSQVIPVLGDVKWSWQFQATDGALVAGILVTDKTYENTQSSGLQTFTILSFHSVTVDNVDRTPSDAFGILGGGKQFIWDTDSQRVESVVGGNGTIVTNTESFNEHLQLVVSAPDISFGSGFVDTQGNEWWARSDLELSTTIEPISDNEQHEPDELPPSTEPLILTYFSTGHDAETGAQIGLVGGLNFGSNEPTGTSDFKIELYLSNNPVVLEQHAFDGSIGQLTVGLPFYHAEFPGTYLLVVSDLRNARSAKMHIRIPAPDGFVSAVDLRKEDVALENNVVHSLLTVQAVGFSGPAQLIFAPYGRPRNGGFLKVRDKEVQQITFTLSRNDRRESYVHVLHSSNFDTAQNAFLNPFTTMIIPDVRPGDAFSIRVKILSNTPGAVTFGGGQLVLLPITR